MIPEEAFAGLLAVTVANLFQLPPVKRKLIFSNFFHKDSIKHLLGLQLWHLFKYAELPEVSTSSKAHSCRFQNLPIWLCSQKNNTLKILHSKS